MILIEKAEVMGFEQAIRGMRNPMNSWDKSDSGICKGGESGIGCDNCAANPCSHGYNHSFQIGKNDYELMMKLVKGGPVHAKFRRMISVYADITAPLYWWKEFDTYKVGTVANSCSSLYDITKKDFTLDDFSHEHLINQNIKLLETIINALNAHRAVYLTTNTKPTRNYTQLSDKACAKTKRDIWWQMIQLLPSSYNQKRTVMLNYEVLAGIYPMRKSHKLDEWREFCHWIEELPYSDVITGRLPIVPFEPNTKAFVNCCSKRRRNQI